MVDGDASAPTPGPLSRTDEVDTERRETRWLLVLIAEIVLFGALALMLAQTHEDSPGAYAYGTRHLHLELGVLVSIALGVATVSMLMVTLEAQRFSRSRVLTLLAVAGVAGLSVPIFFGMEYSRTISWDLVRPRARQTSDAASSGTFAATPSAPMVKVGDLAKGQAAWKTTCRACHGVAGEGIAGQGKDIRGSQFIAGKTDDQLIDFVKVGRMPFDPLNTTGIQMPPKGGNPLLKDQDLRDIVAYVRTFKAPEVAAGAGDQLASKDVATDQAAAADTEFFIARSVIPPAPPGPPGISFANLTWTEYKLRSLPIPPPTDPRIDPFRPADAGRFFRIFAIAGALCALHVLFGLMWIARSARLAAANRQAALAPSLAMGARSWATITVIWIIMFPLFYLIS